MRVTWRTRGRTRRRMRPSDAALAVLLGTAGCASSHADPAALATVTPGTSVERLEQVAGSAGRLEYAAQLADGGTDAALSYVVGPPGPFDWEIVFLCHRGRVVKAVRAPDDWPTRIVRTGHHLPLDTPTQVSRVGELWAASPLSPDVVGRPVPADPRNRLDRTIGALSLVCTALTLPVSGPLLLASELDRRGRLDRWDPRRVRLGDTADALGRTYGPPAQTVTGSGGSEVRLYDPPEDAQDIGARPVVVCFEAGRAVRVLSTCLGVDAPDRPPTSDEAWRPVPAPLPPAPVEPPWLIGAGPTGAIHLDPFYHTLAGPAVVPVVGSVHAEHRPVFAACSIVTVMLSQRPDLATALADRRVRVAIVDADKRLGDLPEYRGRPDARGVPASEAVPVCAVGAETLPHTVAAPARDGSVLIDVFSRTMLAVALEPTDPAFARQLTAAYLSAKADGRWTGSTTADDRAHYWAAGTQRWFDAAGPEYPGEAGTQAGLRRADPALVALLGNVYPSDRRWDRDGYCEGPTNGELDKDGLIPR